MRAIEPERLAAEVAGEGVVLVVVGRPGDKATERLVRSVESVFGARGWRSVRVDLGKDPAVMAELKIELVPELLIYRDGEIFERKGGAMDDTEAEDLASFVASELERGD